MPNRTKVPPQLTRTCSNCKHWLANHSVVGDHMSRLYGREENDCEHPEFSELVYCLSPAHNEQPTEYPQMGVYRTAANFGCVLFEQK